jgi:hypothetical protein
VKLSIVMPFHDKLRTLPTRSRGDGDRRAGRAGADRKAVEQASGQVGGAQGKQLLVGIHHLPPLGG